MSMVGSLLSRIWWWPVVRRIALWRWNLAFYWFTWEKDNLIFVALMGGVFALFGSFGYFAYTDHMRIAADQRRHADLTCLAQNIYFEARGEPIVGQYAVGEVTLNRVKSRHYPNTVCEVVHEKRWDPIRNRYVGAFSWTELESTPGPKGIAWERAAAAAVAVYDAQQPPVAQGALFYHASTIEPAWAKPKKPVARIGRHIFYE